MAARDTDGDKDLAALREDLARLREDIASIKSTIAGIGKRSAQEAKEAGSAKLLLNFRNVDHLSSAALGMLITLNKKVKEKHGVLKLSDINRQIFEVFKITRLDRVFDIHESADHALASF